MYLRSPYYLSGPCPTTKDNILLPKNRTSSTDICLLIWICILAVSGLHTDLEQEIILLIYEYNEFLEWGLNLQPLVRSQKSTFVEQHMDIFIKSSWVTLG